MPVITLEKAKKYESVIEKFLRAVEYQKKVLQVNTRLIEAAYRYYLPFVDAYMKYTNGEINKAFSKKYIKKSGGFQKDRAVDITTNLLDWGELDNTGVKMLKPATLEVMARSGDVANKIAGIEGAFDIVNPEVVAAVNKIALNAVVEVGKETKLAINKIIRQGLIDGKSMGKIARELRPLVGLTSRQATAVEKYRKWLDLKRPELTALKRQKWVEKYRNKLHKYRTELISRTESMRAVSEGQRISYRDAGYTILRWEANVDACPDCDARSGHTYTVEEAEGLIPLHPACYSNETEVYSNKGWKLFKDLKGEELILSLNPKTFGLEWLPYVKKIEYHYKGKMIHLKNRQIDLLATPNHSQLYSKNSKWEIEELQEVIKYPKFRIPWTVNWKGKDLKIEAELFDISKKNNSTKKIDYDGMVYDVELPHNHVLWVKRNGKTCWSGNCRCTWVPESRARKLPEIPKLNPSYLDMPAPYSEKVVERYIRDIKSHKRVVPVFVDKENYRHIVDGLHRATAYERLGMKVPVLPVNRVDALTTLAKPGMTPEKYFNQIRQLKVVPKVPTGRIKQLNEIEKFNKKYANAEKEHCIMVNRKGETLLEKTGSKKRLVFTDEEFNKMKIDKDTIFVHNHPGSSSFSADDLNLLGGLNPNTEMRIVSSKYKYTARIVDKSKFPIDGYRLKKHYDDLNNSLWYKYNDLYKEGSLKLEFSGLSAEELAIKKMELRTFLSQKQSHDLIERISKRYGIEYKRMVNR